jgi:hypothetical protein
MPSNQEEWNGYKDFKVTFYINSPADLEILNNLIKHRDAWIKELARLVENDAAEQGASNVKL